MFMEKYDSLALYDEGLKKRLIIEKEELQFDKNDGWTLIVIIDEPNGLMSNHDNFSFIRIYFIEFNKLVRKIIFY